MKCKFCDSEWQSIIAVKTCPFCGKSLAEPPIFSDIEQVLHYILNTYGESVDKNPNSLIAYLGDLAPGLTNERRLLKMCADAGIIAELISVTNQAERSLTAKRAVTVLSNTYFLDTKWAETAVGWLTVSMDWTSPKSSVWPAEEKREMPTFQQKVPQLAQRRPGVGVELELFKEESTQQECIRKRREELKQYAGRIVCCDTHILALRSNGTVVACGNNDDGQCNMEGWRDVTDIACDSFVSAGLTVDRTVLCTATDLYDYDQWQNIVQIAFWGLDPVGLCVDGTVVAETKDGWDKDFVVWRNVTAITSSVGTVYGLLADGAVVACGANSSGECNVEDWKDVISIVAETGVVYGIRKDGRVYARGENECGQCDVGRWRNIIRCRAGV